MGGLMGGAIYNPPTGGGGSPLNFSNAEVPTGTINSSNKVFTLAHTPNPAATLQLFLNGLVQTPGGVDFTLSGATITYVNAPTTGDAHVAWYQY